MISGFKLKLFLLPIGKYDSEMMDIVGLIGLGLIVTGFGYEMLKTIQRKKCEMNRRVVGIFIVASLLLFYHAFILNDPIFMALNIVLSGINIVNFYYA